MAILKLLMPFLLFSSYSSPSQQCTLSQFPLLDLCSIKFLCQTDIYFVVAASDVLSSMLVKSSFVAVPKKHWNMQCTKQIPLSKNCKKCQIILPRLSKYRFRKFFYLLMSNQILTTQNQNLILQPALLLMKQPRIRMTYVTFWILCECMNMTLTSICLFEIAILRNKLVSFQEISSNSNCSYYAGLDISRIL